MNGRSAEKSIGVYTKHPMDFLSGWDFLSFFFLSIPKKNLNTSLIAIRNPYWTIETWPHIDCKLSSMVDATEPMGKQ